MDPFGFSAAAVMAAAQLVGTEAALAAPEVQAMDFSLAAMFIRATTVVQIVMLMLVAASFWSWAIIVEKVLVFSRLTGKTSKFEDRFWSGKPLDELFDSVGTAPQTPIERIFTSGMTEWRRSLRQEGGLIPGTQSRVDRAMNVAIARESEQANKRLSYLATVGSQIS